MKYKNIMIIENGQGDGALIKDAAELLHPEINCRIESDPSRAFRYLQANSIPDLLFLDYTATLPDGCKLKNVISATESLKTLYVITYYIYAREGTGGLPSEKDVDFYLAKPINLGWLADIMGYLIKI